MPLHDMMRCWMLLHAALWRSWYMLHVTNFDATPQLRLYDSGPWRVHIHTILITPSKCPSACKRPPPLLIMLYALKSDQNKRTCGRVTSSSCDSAYFSTFGLEYSSVCGMIRAYQYGATVAFYFGVRSIDQNYLSGFSLTHGRAGHRTHIWSFVAGLGEDLTLNPLPTNDAPMRHDLSELSISLWEFIWGF